MSNPEDTHNHSHALASLIQEAIEDYMREHLVDGDGYNIVAVFLATSIVCNGWFAHLLSLGASDVTMRNLTLQGAACASKLLQHLRAENFNIPRTVSDENSGDTTDTDLSTIDPSLWMRGPKEEC